MHQSRATKIGSGIRSLLPPSLIKPPPTHSLTRMCSRPCFFSLVSLHIQEHTWQSLSYVLLGLLACVLVLSEDGLILHNAFQLKAHRFFIRAQKNIMSDIMFQKQYLAMRAVLKEISIKILVIFTHNLHEISLMVLLLSFFLGWLLLLLCSTRSNKLYCVLSSSLTFFVKTSFIGSALYLLTFCSIAPTYI